MELLPLLDIITYTEAFVYIMPINGLGRGVLMPVD